MCTDKDRPYTQIKVNGRGHRDTEQEHTRCIIEAEIKDRQAFVTVKFVSELISVTRDADGEVVEGDPKKVREVTDIWTFAREVASRNPNWKLVATEAAN